MGSVSGCFWDIVNIHTNLLNLLLIHMSLVTLNITTDPLEAGPTDFNSILAPSKLFDTAGDIQLWLPGQWALWIRETVTVCDISSNECRSICFCESC